MPFFQRQLFLFKNINWYYHFEYWCHCFKRQMFIALKRHWYYYDILNIVKYHLFLFKRGDVRVPIISMILLYKRLLYQLWTIHNRPSGRYLLIIPRVLGEPKGGYRIRLLPSMCLCVHPCIHAATVKTTRHFCVLKLTPLIHYCTFLRHLITKSCKA